MHIHSPLIKRCVHGLIFVLSPKFFDESSCITICFISEALSTPSRRVWFKMDALQPSGSFKIRGMAKCVQEAKERGCPSVVCASGGNAGLAVAHAARFYSLPCHVVLPATSLPIAKERLELLGTKVTLHGNTWSDSDVYAREIASGSGGWKRFFFLL